MKSTLYICVMLFFYTSCDDVMTTLFDNTHPITISDYTSQNKSAESYILFINEQHEKTKLECSSFQNNTMIIPIKRNHLTPILFFYSNIDDKPMGCVYPMSTTLDTHGGFAAWILYRLLQASHNDTNLTHTYLSHFNWIRFVEKIKEYEDPWVLNQDLILENISDRTFNVYSIKEK